MTRMNEADLSPALKGENRAARAVGAPECSLLNDHQNESMTRNRFKTVVGRKRARGRFCAMIIQRYQLYFERTDASRNMARFYAMSIEPNLFGEACLTRRWGRIGTRGQMMIHHFERERDAVVLFLDLLRQKRGKGYGTVLDSQCQNRKHTPSNRTSTGPTQ
jgi:predicted DNA-binding WGR domain protein